jgi:hypothetical protein
LNPPTFGPGGFYKSGKLEQAMSRKHAWLGKRDTKLSVYSVFNGYQCYPLPKDRPNLIIKKRRDF